MTFEELKDKLKKNGVTKLPRGWTIGKALRVIKNNKQYEFLMSEQPKETSK